MITLFNQTRKQYNQNKKIPHLTSCMALQPAPLISTTIVTRNRNFLSVPCDYGSMEPSNSVSGISDGHVELLIAGNFKIICNLDKILVYVMCYNICDHT